MALTDKTGDINPVDSNLWTKDKLQRAIVETAERFLIAQISESNKVSEIEVFFNVTAATEIYTAAGIAVRK